MYNSQQLIKPMPATAKHAEVIVMFCIQLLIHGEIKYLFNERCAVYTYAYAMKFHTKKEALAYMADKQVARECRWWVAYRWDLGSPPPGGGRYLPSA